MKHMGWFLSNQVISKYHISYVKNMVLHPRSPGGAGRAGRAAVRAAENCGIAPIFTGPGAFSGAIRRQKAGRAAGGGWRVAENGGSGCRVPSIFVQGATYPIHASRGGGRRQCAAGSGPGAGVRGGGIAAHGPRWALPGTFQAGRGRRAGASLTHKKTPGRYPRGVVLGAGPVYSSGRCRTIFHQNNVKAKVSPITVGG